MNGKARGVGLAPTPETLEATRKGAELPRTAEAIDNADGSVSLVSFQPLHAIRIKQELYSVFWKYNKDILDQLEMLLPNDRQFQVARRVAMDKMNAQWEEMKAVINRILILESDSKEK